ncbi:cytochrome c [Neomegalonema perideroedes]|uniref:cytochrome c n=1 Tax=Neomegalonema perideroedes TaxID=217219 RepID=UPI0003672F70|nr:cytochrome c [Neomegalonema perideroedes]
MAGLLRRALKGGLVLAAAVGAALAVPAFAPGLVWSRAATTPAGFAPSAERGAYLYAAGGCASCHATPGREDGAPAGGHELASPFGSFLVPNITPDRETGIGGWSGEDFIRAMTLGIDPKGRHLYPAFPYASYARMTNEDLLDLKAHLDSLEPVARANQPHQLGFPFSVRPGLALWKLAFFDPTPDSRLPVAASAAARRGAYLAEGPGHCAECHSDRNFAGAIRPETWMAGTPAGPDGRRVPGIRGADLGGWEPEDLVFALEYGMTPDGDELARGMDLVVRENTSKLTPEDREAIAAYLMSLRGS